MDFEEFNSLFCTEKQCLDYLFQLRWPQGYHCPRCQWNEMWPVAEYKYKCKNCGYQTTVTAGTLFQDTHIPLTKWFRAAWYISTRPEKVTYSQIQRELELGSRHTSQLIVDKLRKAAFQPQHPKLEGTVEVKRSSIMTSNGKQSIHVALETGENQAGMIRLSRCEFSPQSSYEFIGSSIKGNSNGGNETEIITDLPLTDEKLKRYGCKRKPVSIRYSYHKSEKVISDLQKDIDNFPPDNTFPEFLEFLDTYCARLNSMKTPIEFNTLLQNAVNLSPVTREEMAAKK